MLKVRIGAIIMLALGVLLGYFIYTSQMNQESKHQFRMGLDLSGGSYLVYHADTSAVANADIKSSMEALRDVIERRVNLFGVSEPNVQIESTTLGGEGKEYRLVVELPGITDLQKAVAMIGQTPLLEFKTERSYEEREKIISAIDDFKERFKNDQTLRPKGLATQDPNYVDTKLTGRYLSKATLQFSQGGGTQLAGEPIVSLEFNSEGGKLFKELTKENIGKTIAIYLDGAPISTPVVQQEITDGNAIITGEFTPEEAKQLVGRLNSGALPVPISLISTNTVGPSLGADAVNAGINATIFGFVFVVLFLIIWYRLPGLLSGVALIIYGVIMLALFKLIPVTLSASGIAGFIISLGIAVDANVLIFERMKEEMINGRTLYDAIHDGFDRAWLSIRDSNISSIISGVVLFWFGSSLIKGFALTFSLGVIVSMFTAITVSRLFLYCVSGRSNSNILRFLYSAGFASGKKDDVTQIS